MPDSPTLKGPAAEAVRSDSAKLVVFAPAGSGKTEVLAQRVSHLVRGGVDPGSIAATTFSRRGARDLRDRIALRLPLTEDGSFARRPTVTTVHGLAHRILLASDPEIADWEVLDQAQLFAFLQWNQARLPLRSLGITGSNFTIKVRDLLAAIEVVDGELLTPRDLGAFGDVVHTLRELLARNRLLTYGLQIVRAVHELADPAVAVQVHRSVRHLLVDEYQDLSEAQHRMVELMKGPDSSLTVIGDDDQTIYAWRGSDASKMRAVASESGGAQVVTLSTNWRCRPSIVEASALVASRIAPRAPKQIEAARLPRQDSLTLWVAESMADEAATIADSIDLLLAIGRTPDSIAILVRTWSSANPITEELDARGIACDTRTSRPLFDSVGGATLARFFAWLVDHPWPTSMGESPDPGASEISDGAMKERLRSAFKVNPLVASQAIRTLAGIKHSLRDDEDTLTLSQTLDALLHVLGVSSSDTSFLPDGVASFTTVVRDYEAAIAPRGITALSRRPGGRALFTRFAGFLTEFGIRHLLNERPPLSKSAVTVTTIHQSKGLEWDYVFLPSLVGGVLPHFMAGRRMDTITVGDEAPVTPYASTLMDERRLLYVGITRAREWVSISTHESNQRGPTTPSMFFKELSDDQGIDAFISLPVRSPRDAPV